ncbi:nitrogen fixation protein NifB [Syntrophus gentianae]|uniref:FeMo cofactor biosynthesis protein NifB n=1 Tax=Syntrophus gentianae TaxID=43775 RepID=A0A1H7YTX9_9BACT|nr:nitrogenase cofactor biosynthesis protein NifB [Syntrophus gentianae]SEM49371.1 nitrogen fixation protein NifB [Syntrophus gentianae]
MNYDNHPCFSEGAKHSFGRIHLPVAPNCNLQCNYCNRDFDCVNESRPGVASAILKPRQAIRYLDEVLERIPNIAVVGIAGPGDPFANPEETLETLRLVREKYPEIMLCVATNGLNLSRYADDLETLKISHVTVTVNAVEPQIGSKIYAWARFASRMYRGVEAANLLLSNQIEAIRKLKERNVLVKINSVVIPGINDSHVAAVAREMAALGADLMNCIPLYHVAGTPFADIAPLPQEAAESIRREAGGFLPQMKHCTRCRADAVGLLGRDQTDEVRSLMRKAAIGGARENEPYVAVASMEGLLVNQHLGEASQLWIFGQRDGKAELVDRRFTPSSGSGADRWQQMADLLQDCRGVLVSGIGRAPQAVLEEAGLRIVVMEGFAREGVEAILSGREIPRMLLRRAGSCGQGLTCSGTGMGCG